MILLTGLAAGCGKVTGDTYCDTFVPLSFQEEETVRYLIEHERSLLEGIVTSNELWEDICS